MTERNALGLFEAFGIELEYMIVDAATLDVQPVADRLLGTSGDLERDHAVWSNELALHVFEIKGRGPLPTLTGAAARFQEEIGEIHARLAPLGACLLPTGMHPWMDPSREFRRWPHENDEVYAAFDRIFDCRGHGWSNLQSIHVNLPFADDAEFGRLHAAVRLVLPLLPALAASTPFRDGGATGILDTRLEVYRGNAARVPSVSGRVIPEPVYTRAAYEQDLLGGIYRDLEPHDPEGILRHEWVNARGAIARFDRGAIEIRVIDMQECPRADLAVAAAAAGAVRALVEERWIPHGEQKGWPVERLLAIFDACVRRGDEAMVEDSGYLRALGMEPRPVPAREVWAHLVEGTVARESAYAEWREFFEVYAREGCLARRILTGAGDRSLPALHAVYRRLAGSLARGELFRSG